MDLRGVLKRLLANILFMDLLLFQVLGAHPFLSENKTAERYKLSADSKYIEKTD
jgi:hypothetical protein